LAVERLVNLLITELLKLKRARMFLISLVGASAAPIMVFIGSLDYRVRKPGEPFYFEQAFADTNLYVLLLIGVLLYGVITAFLFNREYVEDTLKSLLTIPVPRTELIVSKLILLLLWIQILSFVAWGLTFILGLIGQYDALSPGLLWNSWMKYMMGGCLLFLLSTPTIFVTLLFKNYVPTIIFTAVVTMCNVALANREYKVLFPWSAVHVVVENGFIPGYPAFYSYAAILLTSAVGFIATVVYFNKSDIH
jgi:bacitracin transport system permease protein